MAFQPKGEFALDRLTDDEIIEYISNARDAGETAFMRSALGVLAYRRLDMVRAKIALKVGDDSDIEDIAMQVMTNAIEAKFEGGHMGEFVNLINRAIQFRIADFYGAKKH
ncbi:MAG: hypothetical protein WBP55_09680, partial [Solirubrobacterales bacterium]